MFGYIASFTTLCRLFLMIDMEFSQDDFNITVQWNSSDLIYIAIEHPTFIDVSVHPVEFPPRHQFAGGCLPGKLSRHRRTQTQQTVYTYLVRSQLWVQVRWCGRRGPYFIVPVIDRSLGRFSQGKWYAVSSVLSDVRYYKTWSRQILRNPS